MSRPERPVADWLAFPNARSRVLALVAPLPVEEVPVPQALHRALHRPVHASVDLPPWDNSAMDGYAVRAADVAGARPDQPVALAVVGEARAGEGWNGNVEPGQAVRITTGAPTPRGADSVVRVEDTDEEERAGRVLVRSDRDGGRNIRPAAQDMRAGDLLLEAGDTLGPGALALAAAAGRTTLPVHRSPSVGILTSGDELRGPDRFEDVRAGLGIPDTNAPLLMGAAAELGARAILLEPARDEPGAVRRSLDAARAEALDLLVTVGGASMGGTDLFKSVLAEMGFRPDFWRVRMRPGSPFSAGLLPRPHGPPLPVLGLPGNPASAFVTFHLFVRPALLRLAGHRGLDLPRLTAEAGGAMAGGSNLAHFPRVRLHVDEGTLVAFPTGPQGSGLVRGLAGTDALAMVPEGKERVEVGEKVTVLLLRLPEAMSADALTPAG